MRLPSLKLVLLVICLLALPAAAATTLTVTNCADSGDGSLRQCLTDAGAGDIIAFNIPNTDPSYEAIADQHVWVIRINSALPTIWVNNVYINGSTQKIFGGDTNIYGPEVVISCEAADIQGIYFASDNSTVEGLAFNNFITSSIYVFPVYCTGNYNNIRGCYFGTDATGEAGAGNSYAIGLKGSNNLIGGAVSDDRNLISGNSNSGIFIWDFYSSINSENNRIIGNYIGIDRTGTVSVPNGNGVYLLGTYAVNNIIGGTTAGERNIISGNSGRAISINSGASSNEVKGNYIGTTTDGAVALSNNSGIEIDGSSYNIIGGTTDGERNIISGNSGYAGIVISGSGADSNVVKGNYVGLDVSGVNRIPNYWGVLIYLNPQHNLIGGATAADRNVISGNSYINMEIQVAGSNEVKGNYIGPRANGTVSTGTPVTGMALNTAYYNKIGGAVAGEGNLISANTIGISVVNSSTNEVKGNYIGTDKDGLTALANGNGITLQNSDLNTIGGSLEAERNIISGNTSYGIYVSDADSNEIKGNYIGLALDGTARGNGAEGIYVAAGSSYLNIIGGNTTFEGNYIGGNGTNGIQLNLGNDNINTIRNNVIGLAPDGVTSRNNNHNGIYLNTTRNNLIENNVVSGHTGADRAGIYISISNYNTIIGNKIGTNRAGTGPVGNNSGIFATSSLYNRIGGTTEAERNLISGNLGYGIGLSGIGSSNEVKGNYIGTDVNGENQLANNMGVAIISSSNNNIIGGSRAGELNLISGNNFSGVYIYDNSDGNIIQSNWIGLKADGKTALGNTHGIAIGAGSGSNTDNNIVGGDTTAEGNVISGNINHGIYIWDCGSGNMIKNNAIGLTSSLEGDLPNGGNGIFINTFVSRIYIISNEASNNGNSGIFSVFSSPPPADTLMYCIGNILRRNQWGLYTNSLTANDQVIFRYGTIEANSSGGVYNNTSYLIDCQYNNWSSPAGPYDPVNNLAQGRWFNPGGDGQSVNDYVDYRYWQGWGTIIPAAPSFISGEAASSTAINWNWNDNTTREALYYVVDATSRAIKVTSPASTVTTTETGLLPYTEYSRRSVAWKMDASSESDAYTVRTLAPETNPPTVEVVVPNGGQVWRGGRSYNITFACSDLSGIKPNSANFYYSTGEGWVTIATSQATNSAYAWTTPAISTTEAKVRVTAQDIYDNTGTDESNAFFTIDLTPSVEVISPNGGEKLKGGVFNNISFTCTSEVGIQPDTASFYYTTGEGWVEITNGKATDAPYAWTTPLISTAEAKVRVTVLDVGDRIGTGESNSFFTIDSSPPMVNVLYPVGGETLRAGRAYNISFSCSDLSGVKPDSANFYYTTGESWVKINTTGQPTNAAYSWVTPLVSTTEAKLRVNVQDILDQTGTGESAGFFTIDITPSIEVTYPNGGQYLKGGAVYNISFSATSEAGIKPDSASFYYTTGESWVLIESGRPTDTSYSWTTPLVSTTEAKVRVTALDVSDRIGTDESDAYFAIDSIPPVVNVISPNGGELWRGGVSQNITWTASDNIGLKTAPITLKYSVNNGADFNTIAAGQANSGTHSWLVPAVNTNEAKVSVTAEDLAGNIATDESNTVFAIDSTAPFVVSITPTNGATAVLISTEVVAVFSKEMSREATQNGFDLSASPGVAGVFDWNAGGTIMTFRPSSDLAYKKLYNVNLAQTATDLAGNQLAAAFSSSFTTISQGDDESPHCVIQIVDRDRQSSTLKRGDYISKRPWIRGVVTDNLSLESSSVKLYLNDTLLSPVMSIVSNKRIEVNYQVTSDLEDETVKSYSLKLEARDTNGNTGEKQVMDLKVSYGSSRIIGPVLSYPQTFKPKSGTPAKLVYNLTADADIMIYFFSTSGENVWSGKYLSGGEGGKAGYNEVIFDGRSLTNGSYLGNGIYTFKITASQRVIGTGYITIFD